MVLASGGRTGLIAPGDGTGKFGHQQVGVGEVFRRARQYVC
jgi:hypothetical protein